MHRLLGVIGCLLTTVAIGATACSIRVPPADRNGSVAATTTPSAPEPARTQVARTEPDRTVDAVRRGLDYLDAEGSAWIAEHDCVSCHQIPIMVWSHEEAARRGVPVDRDKLARWREWSIGKAGGRGNPDGKVQLILGLDRLADPAVDSALRRLSGDYLARQDPDGSWEPGGQLPAQRRPEEETRAVSSMWGLLALGKLDVQAPGVERGLERAGKWLDDPSAGVSTEAVVVRALLADDLGDPARAADWLDRLIELQNPDGGWGWLAEEASDGFGTGLAVYALTVAGRDQDDQALERGRSFLLDSQREDGSWHIPSTHGPKGKQRVADGWGSGWAVLALARTLPE